MMRIRYTTIGLFAAALCASTVFAETTITINGKTIRTSGGSITVTNGSVIVDGKVLTGNVLEGSGKSATEERELGDFNGIQLNVSADVTVTAGNKPQFKITADDNILPLILSEISGNMLRITTKDSFSSSQRIKITIVAPLITHAEINGSGNIDITDVTGDQIALEISGSGDITASGEVANLRATIRGSGDIHAGGLESETATIIVNGSGDADVHATDTLKANVRGSGDITYHGSPPEVHTSVSGSGSIARK